MLRSHNHTNVQKLNNLNKAYKIIKQKIEEIRGKFINNQFSPSSPEYEQLEKELEDAEDVENFLLEEISIFQSEHKLMLVDGTNISVAEKSVCDVLFEMEHKKKYWYWNEYKEVKEVHSLYYKALSIYNHIVDIQHLEKLIIYYDSKKFIDDVQKAHFSFEILDKEDETRRKYNEYKVAIVCDNGLTLEIFVNTNINDFEFIKLYTRDYEDDYCFTGTFIKEIDVKFNLLRMMKTITTTGQEKKNYKMYIK